MKSNAPSGPPGGHLGELFAAPLTGGGIASSKASIVVVEWIDEGGGADPPRYIAPLHVHHDDDEAWYVLEGALRVRLDGDDVDVPAGGAVLCPRGTPHTYWNPYPEPTRYLLIMTPRIQRLIEALHAGADADQPAIENIFRHHHSEYLGWP
jgi:mannose-6-phosphate isomerase-like protein (cupin superfamily)